MTNSFVSYFYNVGQIEEDKYGEMKSEREANDRHKKSLANVLSLCVFFSLSLVCLSRFQEVKRTRETDRKQEWFTNRVYVCHIAHKAASTDGYLFSESCIMFGCAHD
jgi:hypothetical protein